MTGVQTCALPIFEALSQKADIELLANRWGNKALPFFLFVAVVKIVRSGRRYDVIHFGDGLLAVLLPIARIFTRTILTITVHGLDVTYSNPVYRMFITPRIGMADSIVAISHNTKRLCSERSIPSDKIIVIPNGIELPTGVQIAGHRPKNLPEDIQAKVLLCTVGRLVKRKGHEWFIRNVLPRLDSSFVYIVAGEGPERSRIERAIIDTGADRRVFLLGAIDESGKEWLLRSSKLFVMPNVPVQGDVEGFGLVLIEAAVRGLFSIASNIDGIPDAVLPGLTGVLVKALDPVSFASSIEQASPDRRSVAEAANYFGWERAADRYFKMMLDTTKAVCLSKTGERDVQ